MASIIKKAASGQKKAMMYLFDKNVQKVFYIADSLLCDHKKSEAATVAVFKEIWTNLNTKEEMTEDGFTALVVEKTIQYCKKKITKQNPKAYRIPAGHNFQLTNVEQESVTEEEFDTYLLNQLPDLQRLIFVLRIICKYNKDQIARELKFKMKTVNLALEAEENNIKRILRAAYMEESLGYSQVVAHFVKKEQDIVVPETVCMQVELYMNERAKPYENKQKKKTILIAIVTAILCIMLGVAIWYAGSIGDEPAVGEETTTTESTTDSSQEETNETDNSEDASTLDESLTYYANIEIQDYGTITVELDQEAAPITVENFVTLAESGFYDGLTFHRIIEDFMMQGGDPNGDGTGGSENTIIGEFSENGYENELSHTRGAIAMARSSEYDSASSQFFIVHEDSTHLDGQYAVFGYVTEGMDIVDAVCEAAEPTDDNGTIESSAQPIITSISIITE